MNAIAPLSRADQDLGGRTLEDGSLVISPEQLARLGNGDVRRGRKEIRLMLAAEKERAIPPSGPVARPTNVRAAVQADEQAVFDLLMMDLKENADPIAPISPEKVMSYVQSATRGRGSLMGVIDGPGGVPVAMVLLVPNQWWWSNSYFIQDQVVYVHPDHRRSNYIDDLLTFSKWAVDKWTSDFGYRIYLLTGVLGFKKVREKVLLFRRKFSTVGIACLYPAPPVE